MMTQDEKFALAFASLEAEKMGDQREAKRLLAMLPLSVGLAKCAFLRFGEAGLEEAKTLGLNFSEVEETYGPQWYKHV